MLKELLEVYWPRVLNNMESMGKQETGVLLQEPTVEESAKPSFFDEENLPFEDFVDMVENELATVEKREGETSEGYLNRIKEERKFFLGKIKDEKKKNVAKIMFDAQEYLVQFGVGVEKGDLPIKLKGAELQRDVAEFIFENNKLEEVTEIWRMYDKFFRSGGIGAQRMGEGMKSAILSMVGMKKILTKNYFAEVKFTIPEVDVFYSIDMVATAKTENPKKGKLFFFQIKSLNGEKVTDVNWKQFGFGGLDWEAGNGLGDKENNFKKGCGKYLEDNNDKFGDIDRDDFSAIFARLPVKSGGKSAIDMMGEPREELEQYVVDQLEIHNPELVKRINV